MTFKKTILFFFCSPFFYLIILQLDSAILKVFFILKDSLIL